MKLSQLDTDRDLLTFADSNVNGKPGVDVSINNHEWSIAIVTLTLGGAYLARSNLDKVIAEAERRTGARDQHRDEAPAL